ncbi:MAG: hypothetical protein U1F11_10330 [Steroidobacteraceae bacterium]
MADPTIAARRPGGVRRFLLKVLVLALLLAAGWTWVTLNWSYSEGERGGTLQKFSRKGWICKTWEGELALYIVSGVAPQIWYFTVRDAATARQLESLVGERVQLHYTEHRGIPTSCFGDTGYFVSGGKPAPALAAPGSPSSPLAPPAAAAPAPAPSANPPTTGATSP